MTFAEDALAHRNTFICDLEEGVSIRALLAHGFLPAVLRTAVPPPPVFVIALAVECSFAGDCDVLLFERVDEGRVVEEFDTFPARENHRQVVFWILTKLDRRAFGDLEVDVALQVNGA